MIKSAANVFILLFMCTLWALNNGGIEYFGISLIRFSNWFIITDIQSVSIILLFVIFSIEIFGKWFGILKLYKSEIWFIFIGYDEGDIFRLSLNPK